MTSIWPHHTFLRQELIPLPRCCRLSPDRRKSTNSNHSLHAQHPVWSNFRLLNRDHHQLAIASVQFQSPPNWLTPPSCFDKAKKKSKQSSLTDRWNKSNSHTPSSAGRRLLIFSKKSCCHPEMRWVAKSRQNGIKSCPNWHDERFFFINIDQAVVAWPKVWINLTFNLTFS